VEDRPLGSTCTGHSTELPAACHRNGHPLSHSLTVSCHAGVLQSSVWLLFLSLLQTVGNGYCVLSGEPRQCFLFARKFHPSA